MTHLLLAVPAIGMPGPMELAIIAFVVVVLFGANKLPKLGKGMGEGIRNFKDGLRALDDSSEPKKSVDESTSK